MKMSKALKIGSLIVILMACLVIGINYGFRLSQDNFVSLIYASIISSAAIFTAVATSKTNTQITDIKTDTKKQMTEFRSDFNELKSKVNYFDESIKVFDYTIKNMDEKQIALDLGFIDISSSIKNKEQINNLCKRMEMTTYDIFQENYKLDTNLSDYIIQVVDGIGIVIKNQYEYGFEEFNPAYFKRKIIKRLDLVSEHAEFNNKSEILASISLNISNYIKEVEKVTYLMNGERRALFDKLTMKMTDRLSKHAIEIFKEEKK